MTGNHPPVPSPHAADASHGSMRSYAIGFAISLALTLGSFGTVMSGVVPPHLRLGVLVLLAVVQLVVQLIYFLHMGTAKSQRENTAIFLCTGLLIAIIVAGSLWVMHNANVNMMPGHGMSVPQAMSHE